MTDQELFLDCVDRHLAATPELSCFFLPLRQEILDGRVSTVYQLGDRIDAIRSAVGQPKPQVDLWVKGKKIEG